MWRCVDPRLTDVSEERIASIFRVENPRAENQRQQACPSLQPPSDADFSTLKMDSICSTETSVNPGSTQRHIPEDDILHRLDSFSP
jgi:hypothetical protein